ncbi:hypothetical protein [Pseudohongiella sp. O18]|uniref:hypothetical protein n=1 Tax=Pseudohongiella sp. O18 TaxID=2904248 RepID=UPI001F20D2A5|nr:hypothetical protein [Pseudohongiella sp. O18]
MTKKEKEESERTCFIIMPIADMEDYEAGHFNRVYTHLIKPACIKAGFNPIRADDVVSSNYIVIDILSKIVESEMVLCDLSGRNPNVLYELGVRQAFNLPTVLIKDIKTNKIFDIQGLRYIEYNQALRIDSVEKQIEVIAKSMVDTAESKGKDVNSLIQLLGVKPATIPQNVELSNEASVLLSAIKDLSGRIGALEQQDNLSLTSKNANLILRRKPRIEKIGDDQFSINGETVAIGDTLYIRGKSAGQLADVQPDKVFIKQKDGAVISVSSSDNNFKGISRIPF